MSLTQNLGITKLSPGQSNAHLTVNDVADVLDKAVAGLQPLALTGSRTLTGGESTAAILRITSATGPTTLTIQALPKTWVLVNESTHAITVQCAGQPTPPVVAAGAVRLLVCTGAAIRLVG